MFSYKIHESGGIRILAVADANIIGKVFMHNGVNIEIKESFYGDNSATADEIASLIKKFLESDSHINAIGNNIVSLLVKEKIISADSSVDLSGIKHAQVYTLD